MFISKKGWTLFNNADEKVVMDELLKTNDGELWIIEGGNPPHKPSSTGRVWVRPLGAEGMQKTMILTERELKALSGQRIKTAGGYYFEEEQDRTKYCRHPEQLDWTQPCPICKRRVRVQ